MKRADLNLLNVFYAIMAEGSVTRAGERLAMTQPAVSNSLKRLRQLFQDELFIKVPGGIRPTEKALAMWPTVEDAMEKVWAITDPPKFDPAETELTFNLAITDSLTSRVIPEVARKLAEQAPRARINFCPHSDAGSTSSLMRGTLDCAVGMFPNLHEGLLVEGLFADDYICVFRPDHPTVRKELTIEQFVGAGHVLVKQSPAQLGIVDAWLELRGHSRKINMVVNTVADALDIVCLTNLITVAPKQYVRHAAADEKVETAQLPFEHPKLMYKLVWHDRHDRDPARIWLRRFVRETIAAICNAETYSAEAPSLV